MTQRAKWTDRSVPPGRARAPKKVAPALASDHLGIKEQTESPLKSRIARAREHLTREAVAATLRGVAAFYRSGSRSIEAFCEKQGGNRQSKETVHAFDASAPQVSRTNYRRLTVGLCTQPYAGLGTGFDPGSTDRPLSTLRKEQQAHELY